MAYGQSTPYGFISVKPAAVMHGTALRTKGDPDPNSRIFLRGGPQILEF
jgi:hypothetical protein